MNTKPVRKVRGCTGKKQHKTEFEAVQERRQLEKVMDTLIIVYQCEGCNFWHTGTTRNDVIWRDKW